MDGGAGGFSGDFRSRVRDSPRLPPCPLRDRRAAVPVNLARLGTIAQEAAEQCERLTVPAVAEPRPLHAALDALPRPPLMVLGFDCILRRLAVEQAGMTDVMTDLFGRYRVCGFNTYGEQISGMHVNQTFVGLALMEPEAGAPDAA